MLCKQYIFSRGDIHGDERIKQISRENDEILGRQENWYHSCCIIIRECVIFFFKKLSFKILFNFNLIILISPWILKKQGLYWRQTSIHTAMVRRREEELWPAYQKSILLLSLFTLLNQYFYFFYQVSFSFSFSESLNPYPITINSSQSNIS